MKILELNFEKSWRGGERQTLYNMQGFRDEGIGVALVCRKGSPLEAKAIRDGFTVHSFDSVLGVIFFLISKGKKYRFIHAQTSHILTYCVFTKLFHGAKIIFTRRVNFKQKGFFTKLKYRFTDIMVAISNEIKNTLTGFCGRSDIKVISDIVVKENAPPERGRKIYPGHGTAGKHFTGTTSAFTEEKDPLTMVEAVKKLSEKRNDFVFLHFGAGVLVEEVRKKIELYQLGNVYRLMGFTDNVAGFLPNFKVFVMTSKQEGLGSSVLDAFINKVPVVSTNAGGLKELLADERGILCNTGDSNAVADGIDTFLNDSIKRNTCIENAFAYVNRHHSMEYITQQYLQLMKG